MKDMTPVFRSCDKIDKLGKLLSTLLPEATVKIYMQGNEPLHIEFKGMHFEFSTWAYNEEHGDHYDGDITGWCHVLGDDGSIWPPQIGAETCVRTYLPFDTYKPSIAAGAIAACVRQFMAEMPTMESIVVTSEDGYFKEYRIGELMEDWLAEFHPQTEETIIAFLSTATERAPLMVGNIKSWLKYRPGNYA